MPRHRRVPRRADHPSLSSRSSRSAFDASPVPRRVAGSSVLAPRASRRRTRFWRRSKDARRPRATRSARNRHPRTRGERKGAWARGTASRRPRRRPRQRPRRSHRCCSRRHPRRRGRRKRRGPPPPPPEARARVSGAGARAETSDASPRRAWARRWRRAARGQPRTSRGFPGRTRRAAARSRRRRRRRRAAAIARRAVFKRLSASRPAVDAAVASGARSERPRSRGHGATRGPRAARSTRRGVAREHRPEVVVDGIVRQLVQIRTVFVGQELAVALVVAPDVPLALAHAREVPVGSGPRRARGVSGAGSRGGAA